MGQGMNKTHHSITHHLLAARTTLRGIASVLLVCVSLAHPNASAQDVSAGERLFQQRCAACHAVQAGQPRLGPHLSGIVGRKAGSVEAANYSQALRDAGFSWDTAQLDAYLANPAGLVRGTTMAISVPNADERARLVAYLATLAPPR